jgi:hypothetical protein
MLCVGGKGAAGFSDVIVFEQYLGDVRSIDRADQQDRLSSGYTNPTCLSPFTSITVAKRNQTPLFIVTSQTNMVKQPAKVANCHMFKRRPNP